MFLLICILLANETIGFAMNINIEVFATLNFSSLFFTLVLCQTLDCIEVSIFLAFMFKQIISTNQGITHKHMRNIKEWKQTM